MSAIQIPEEFTVVVLEVGGIAHLGAILKGKGAKKIKGAIGGQSNKEEKILNHYTTNRALSYFQLIS